MTIDRAQEKGRKLEKFHRRMWRCCSTPLDSGKLGLVMSNKQADDKTRKEKLNQTEEQRKEKGRLKFSSAADLHVRKPLGSLGGWALAKLSLDFQLRSMQPSPINLHIESLYGLDVTALSQIHKRNGSLIL